MEAEIIEGYAELQSDLGEDNDDKNIMLIVST